ncbi:MAG: aminomethyltransferase beta-barrel domain-containing protein, partial [Acidimicrobiia bacterium]|nr:aminomethyltransferase beta-barrel domain-containing protein [Acidimicrobiia bacterium]
VGDGDIRDFLRRRVPGAGAAGPIVDTSGDVVGQHDGAVGYTVGQRRGLGVALGERRYVVDVRPETSTVVIGTRSDLMAAGCRLEDVSWVDGDAPADTGDLSVQIRYRSAAVAASVTATGDGADIRFAEPVAAVAPGQAGVVYRGDEVLGGGTIASAVG